MADTERDTIPNTTDTETDTSRLTPFSRVDNEVFITGANLRVVNGTGTTDGEPNALGNVIIGYNKLRGGTGGNDCSGSHMLVVGNGNNYSRFGGIVVGLNNTASGTASFEPN